MSPIETSGTDEPRTLAVVEDNPDNRLLLEAILEDRFRIVEYDNGLEALEGLRRSPPDAVLLDISLPGMDGIEVLGQIRRTKGLEGLRVVALTAHAMSGDRERFLEMGFDAYLSKPITDEKILLETIEGLFA